MSETIRRERRVGVTDGLQPIQRRNLMSLRHSEVWDDLLDLMEMACIEKETELINTDPADKEQVLARHIVAKTMWVTFAYMQERIDVEIAAYVASTTPQPIRPEPDDEELERENILDPTRGKQWQMEQ
jgi:hypothetical protein